MEVRLHKKAGTTLEVRKEIKESKESIYALAKKYNLHYYTVKKWKERENVLDKSSRPHKMNITLTTEQEDLILFERKHDPTLCVVCPIIL